MDYCSEFLTPVMFLPRLIFLVTDLAILLLLRGPPISLLGAILCFLRTSADSRLADSRDDTRLPFEEPKEHRSHPITLCSLQWPV